MQNVVKRNRAAYVPLNVQYADIDYMEAAKDFTVDSRNYRGSKDYFHQLNDEGVRTINNLKDYSPTMEGMQKDVYIKWEDGKTTMKGAC